MQLEYDVLKCRAGSNADSLKHTVYTHINPSINRSVLITSNFKARVQGWSSN